MARIRIQEHLRLQEHSGLSIGEYAKKHGLNPHRLYTERWRLRNTEKFPKNPAGKFVPVQIDSDSRTCRISIEFSSDGHCRIQAKDLLEVFAFLTAG